MTPRLLALIAALAGGTSLPASAATLTLELQQVAGPGDVMVAVFNQPDQWLKKPLRGLRQPAVAGTMTVTVADLPPGDYAVSMFIDRNGNGTLDRNPMGLPIEPYAFSNDATGTFGPPSFDQARLTLRSDTRAVIRVP